MDWLKNKVVINADDFGYSPLVNEAIDESFQKEYIHQTSIMVNMPSFNDAVTLSKNHGYFGKIGLHINLTEGVPLTDGIKSSELCTNGLFNQLLVKNKKKRLFINKQEQFVIREELKAQIECYLNQGFSLNHLDSHQHIHTNLSIIKILYPLLREYGFKSIRLSRFFPQMKSSLINLIYKKIYNAVIYSYNQNNAHDVYKKLKYFGSFDDWMLMDTSLKSSRKYAFEIMVHPIKQNGMIYDSVNHKKLFKG